MISDYKDILTKHNLDLFSESSPLIKSITNYEWVFIVDFLYKEEFPSELKMTHELSEIKVVLEVLGVFSNEISTQAKDIYDKTRISISEDYFDKLKRLTEIMYYNSNILHRIKLTTYAKQFELNSISPLILSEELNTSKKIFLNDCEMLCYSIISDNPRRFTAIETIVKWIPTLTTFPESGNIKWIKISWGTICETNWNPIMMISGVELKIINFLKNHIDTWGSTIENIKSFTWQLSIDATKQSIKVLNKKIKESQIKHFIYIEKPRSINQYLLKLKK